MLLWGVLLAICPPSPKSSSFVPRPRDYGGQGGATGSMRFLSNPFCGLTACLANLLQSHERSSASCLGRSCLGRTKARCFVCFRTDNRMKYISSSKTSLILDPDQNYGTLHRLLFTPNPSLAATAFVRFEVEPAKASAGRCLNRFRIENAGHSTGRCSGAKHWLAIRASLPGPLDLSPRASLLTCPQGPV
jgi:hypothetical protein